MAKGDAGGGADLSALSNFKGQGGWGSALSGGMQAAGDSMNGTPPAAPGQDTDDMGGLLKSLMDNLWLKKQQPLPSQSIDTGPPAQAPSVPMDGGMSAYRMGGMDG